MEMKKEESLCPKCHGTMHHTLPNGASAPCECWAIAQWEDYATKAMAGKDLLKKSKSIEVSNFPKIIDTRWNYLIEAETNDGSLSVFPPHFRRALEHEFSCAQYAGRPPMTFKEIMMTDVTLYDFKERNRGVCEKLMIEPQLLVIKAPVWPPWGVNYLQTESLIADRSSRNLTTWLVCASLLKLKKNTNVPASFMDWIKMMVDKGRFERISLAEVKEEAIEKKKKREINVNQGLGLTGINQSILEDSTGTIRTRIPAMRKSLERSFD